MKIVSDSKISTLELIIAFNNTSFMKKILFKVKNSSHHLFYFFLYE